MKLPAVKGMLVLLNEGWTKEDIAEFYETDLERVNEVLGSRNIRVIGGKWTYKETESE